MSLHLSEGKEHHLKIRLELLITFYKSDGKIF